MVIGQHGLIFRENSINFVLPNVVINDLHGTDILEK